MQQGNHRICLLTRAIAWVARSTTWSVVALVLLLVAATYARRRRAPLPDDSRTAAGSRYESPLAPVDLVLFDARAELATMFPEELAVLTDDVRAFLVSQPLLPARLISRADVRAAWEEAARGSERCRVPAPMSEAVRGAFPDAFPAFVTASCASRPCTLSVQILQPGKGGALTRLAMWTARVERPETVDAWREATLHLTADTGAAPDTAVVNPRGGAPAVHLQQVTATGAWRARPETAAFAERRPALDACHVASWPWAEPEEVTLALDEDGAVVRCHVDTNEQDSDEPRLACLCGALSRPRFEPGEAGRRVGVRILNEPVVEVREGGRRFGAAFGRITSGTGLIPRRWLTRASVRLAGCYAAAHPTGDKRLKLWIDAAPDGTVTGARVVAGVPSDSPLARCLVDVLRRTALPCMPRGASDVLIVVLALSASEER